MKVIGHRISIQTLLFQTCLPTRQNGIENRDKAYSNELFFIQKYPGFLSRCRIKSLQGGVGGGGGRAGHFTGVAALVAAWLGISLAWSTYTMHLGMKQRFKRCATVMPNSIHKL